MDAAFRAQINNQFHSLSTTSSYQTKVEDHVDEYHSDYLLYWRIIPEYTVSICPFCLVAYRQQLDLYSLYAWEIRHDGDSLRYCLNGRHTCEHFVAVHEFLNLNQMRPFKKELHHSALHSTEPEVPFISPSLLPDDVDSKAVIHSLPICRIKGDSFVPKYTLYLLTYYAQDAEAVRHRRVMEWTDGQSLRYVTWSAPGLRLGMYWEQAQDRPEMWDLESWWRRGKLRWVNPTSMTLNDADAADFPYRALQGLRHGYIYQAREFTTLPTQETVQQYRDHLPHLQRAQEESYQRNLKEQS
jgi:hypothetical protein